MKDIILILLIYVLGIGALFLASNGYTTVGMISMLSAEAIIIYMIVKAYKLRKS